MYYHTLLVVKSLVINYIVIMAIWQMIVSLCNNLNIKYLVKVSKFLY